MNPSQPPADSVRAVLDKLDVQMPESINIDYEKGNYFRVIHMDGAHGGVSPDGNSIVMSVYSERKPIPQHEVMKIDGSGSPIGITNREYRKTNGVEVDVFREVEATLIMDVSTALGLAQWLQQKVAEFEEVKRIRVAVATEQGKKNA